MTKGKQIRNKIFTITIIILSLALCVMMADLLSSAITVSNIYGSNTKLSIGSYEIYGLSVYKSENANESKEYAKTIWQTGAAGFVWQENKTFYVLTSVYENESDAQKVLEKLSENFKPNSQIVKITISAINIDKDFNASDKGHINSALTLFKNTYKKLYDISVSLDTQIISETEAKLNINNLLSEVTKTTTNFETIFKSKFTTDTLAINIKLQNVLEKITKLSDLELLSPSQTLSSLIKYTYINVLKSYQSLANELISK